MTDPLLIDAKFLEVTEPKPPARGEWFLILYVTHGGWWTVYRESKSSTAAAYLNEAKARQVIAEKKLRHARIVRVEGEAKP